MPSIYILIEKKTNKTYTGSTDSLERRLREHDSGKCRSTRYGSWKLFYKEDYPSLPEARKREKYLKSCSGRKFIRKLFGQDN